MLLSSDKAKVKVISCYRIPPLAGQCKTRYAEQLFKVVPTKWARSAKCSDTALSTFGGEYLRRPGLVPVLQLHPDRHTQPKWLS